MTMKLDRTSYGDIIAGDLEWLNAQPRTLERDHVIAIVNTSATHEYECCDLRRQLAEALKEIGKLNDDANAVREVARRDRLLASEAQAEALQLRHALQWAVDNSDKAQGQRGQGLPMMRAALSAPSAAAPLLQAVKMAGEALGAIQRFDSKVGDALTNGLREDLQGALAALQPWAGKT